MACSSTARKVICFHCQASTCSCVAQFNQTPEPDENEARITRVIAWLGGACLAGGAFGAFLAVVLGG
jgi:hypothetical protein